MRKQWFTRVRLPNTHLTRSNVGPFPQSLPTPTLNRHDTTAVWALRLFSEPGGPTPITETARNLNADLLHHHQSSFRTHLARSSKLEFKQRREPVGGLCIRLHLLEKNTLPDAAEPRQPGAGRIGESRIPGTARTSWVEIVGHNPGDSDLIGVRSEQGGSEALCNRGNHAVDQAARCDARLPAVAVDGRRGVEVDHRIETEQLVPKKQVAQIRFASIRSSSRRDLHHDRLGSRQRTVILDQRRQPDIDAAAGGTVVLHPRGTVGEDQGQRGPVSCGS